MSLVKRYFEDDLLKWADEAFEESLQNPPEPTEPEDWDMIDPSQGGMCGCEEEE